MLCLNHGPRALATTKTWAYGLVYCLPECLGPFFLTAWQAMIKSYSNEWEAIFVPEPVTNFCDTNRCKSTRMGLSWEITWKCSEHLLNVGLFDFRRQLLPLCLVIYTRVYHPIFPAHMGTRKNLKIPAPFVGMNGCKDNRLSISWQTLQQTINDVLISNTIVLKRIW